MSLLVLTGTRALAQTQRLAVQDLIVPRIQAGERVWFAGHWGFHWYAQLAGARPAVWEGAVPQPDDLVVVSEADSPVFARRWTRKQVIDRVAYDIPGRVMDSSKGAGFFSNEFGYLPWVWSNGKTNVFEVWKVE